VAALPHDLALHTEDRRHGQYARRRNAAPSNVSNGMWGPIAPNDTGARKTLM